MRITVKLYGNLRRYAEGRRETSNLTVQDGITVEQLLSSLGIPENGWWMAAVNDVVVQPKDVLNENDVVEVFDPVGGG